MVLHPPSASTFSARTEAGSLAESPHQQHRRTRAWRQQYLQGQLLTTFAIVFLLSSVLSPTTCYADDDANHSIRQQNLQSEPDCQLVGGDEFVCDVNTLLTEPERVENTVVEAVLTCPLQDGGGVGLAGTDPKTCECMAELMPEESQNNNGTSSIPARQCSCHFCQYAETSSAAPPLAIDCSNNEDYPYVIGTCQSIGCDGACLDDTDDDDDDTSSEQSGDHQNSTAVSTLAEQNANNTSASNAETEPATNSPATANNSSNTSEVATPAPEANAPTPATVATTATTTQLPTTITPTSATTVPPSPTAAAPSCTLCVDRSAPEDGSFRLYYYEAEGDSARSISCADYAAQLASLASTTTSCSDNPLRIGYLGPGDNIYLITSSANAGVNFPLQIDLQRYCNCPEVSDEATTTPPCPSQDATTNRMCPPGQSVSIDDIYKPVLGTNAQNNFTCGAVEGYWFDFVANDEAQCDLITGDYANTCCSRHETTTPTTVAPTQATTITSPSDSGDDITIACPSAFCPDNMRVPDFNKDIVVDESNDWTCGWLEENYLDAVKVGDCEQLTRSGAICCTEMIMEQDPPTTTTYPPTSPPTQNGTIAVQVNSSILVYNMEGYPAAVLMAGPEMEGLNKSYAVFVEKVVAEAETMEGNSTASVSEEELDEEDVPAAVTNETTTTTKTTTTRYLRHRAVSLSFQQPPRRQLQQEEGMVMLDSSSPRIHTLLDADCPSTVPVNVSCAVAYGSYDLLLWNHTTESSATVGSRYQNYTQEAIDRGLLNETLAVVDPESLLVIVGPTDDLVPYADQETPEPTLSPEIEAAEGGYDEYFKIGVGLSIATIVICLVAIMCASDMSGGIADDDSVEPWERKSATRNSRNSQKGGAKESAPSKKKGRGDRQQAAEKPKTERQEYTMYRAQVEELVQQKTPEESDNIDALMDLFYQREPVLIATLKHMPDCSEHIEEMERLQTSGSNLQESATNLQGSANLHGSINLQGSANLQNSSNLQGSSNNFQDSTANWSCASYDEFGEDTRDGSESEAAAEEDAAGDHEGVNRSTRTIEEGDEGAEETDLDESEREVSTVQQHTTNGTKALEKETPKSGHAPVAFEADGKVKDDDDSGPAMNWKEFSESSARDEDHPISAATATEEKSAAVVDDPAKNWVDIDTGEGSLWDKGVDEAAGSEGDKNWKDDGEEVEARSSEPPPPTNLHPPPPRPEAANAPIKGSSVEKEADVSTVDDSTAPGSQAVPPSTSIPAKATPDEDSVEEWDDEK